MDVSELKQLIRWCSLAKNNEHFWSRFVLAAHAYDKRTFWAMLALAGLAQSKE